MQISTYQSLKFAVWFENALVVMVFRLAIFANFTPKKEMFSPVSYLLGSLYVSLISLIEICCTSIFSVISECAETVFRLYAWYDVTE